MPHRLLPLLAWALWTALCWALLSREDPHHHPPDPSPHAR